MKTLFDRYLLALLILGISNGALARAELSPDLSFEGVAFLADLRFKDSEYQEISFIGQFAQRDRSELKRLVQSLKPQVPIRISILSSLGGYRKVVDELIEGIQSKCQRSAGCEIQTFLQGVCHSACTYFFLAGERRWVSRSAEIGLHRKWAVSPYLAVQSKKSMEAEYRALGADGAWWDRHPEALTLKRQVSLSVLDPREAIEARFATDYWDSLVAPWSLAGRKNSKR